MHFHAAVEAAIQHAPLVDASVLSTSNQAWYELADKPDDFPVVIEPARPAPLNEVAFDANDDRTLGCLIAAWADVTGTSIDTTYINAVIPHENLHYRAAKRLGAIGTQCGITALHLVGSNGRAELTFQPFTKVGQLRTTKLGRALIAAHPLDPSPGDCAVVCACGYKSIDELAAIAMQRNRQSGAAVAIYPVPLSHAGTGRHRLYYGSHLSMETLLAIPGQR